VLGSDLGPSPPSALITGIHPHTMPEVLPWIRLETMFGMGTNFPFFATMFRSGRCLDAMCDGHETKTNITHSEKK